MAAPDLDQPPRRTALKVALRVIVVLVALGASAVVLFGIFDDLDPAEIGDALGRLSDAEWLALGFGWLVWIGCQGLLTASLVHHLPARRGVLAALGPNAVASVVPGPSDLPVRYAMFQSWGVGRAEAATAVASSGIFSVGSQLALPAIAGVAIFVGDIPLGGFMAVIVTATLVLAAAIALAAFVLGSASRTEWLATRVEPAWRWLLRLLRRDPPSRSVAAVVVEQRAASIAYLRDKWVGTTLATVATIAAKCSLLIMSLRFVGIPEDALGWAAIFAVYALVAGITTIPISPGGAGVSELAYIGMLTPIAGQGFVNEVAAGVLLFRLLTWILMIPAGLVALTAWKVRTARRAEREGGTTIVAEHPAPDLR